MSRQLHHHLERLSNLFRAQLREHATSHGLKLVQLEALLYLDAANRYSDTAAGLTQYLGVTKGTVSQTLGLLVRRGLVDKVPDPDDGRVLHCRLTPAGQAIAQATHAQGIFGDEHAEIEATLRELLARLQRERGSRMFGMCRTCRHFQREGPGLARCGLTTEPLSEDDSLLICREHEVA